MAPRASRQSTVQNAARAGPFQREIASIKNDVFENIRAIEEVSGRIKDVDRDPDVRKPREWNATLSRIESEFTDATTARETLCGSFDAILLIRPGEAQTSRYRHLIDRTEEECELHQQFTAYFARSARPVPSMLGTDRSRWGLRIFDKTVAIERAGKLMLRDMKRLLGKHAPFESLKSRAKAIMRAVDHVDRATKPRNRELASLSVAGREEADADQQDGDYIYRRCGKIIDKCNDVLQTCRVQWPAQDPPPTRFLNEIIFIHDKCMKLKSRGGTHFVPRISGRLGAYVGHSETPIEDLETSLRFIKSAGRSPVAASKDLLIQAGRDGWDIPTSCSESNEQESSGDSEREI